MQSTSFELANELFGKKRAETKKSSNTVSQLTGVALCASEDGKVSVQLDETGETVELASTPAVEEGDHVVITASGGNLKTLSVTENAGAGDKAKAETDEAKKVATNYIDIDENKGITVGNMTEETLGKNAYIDADGFYVRDGDTILSSFEADKISIGKNSRSAQIGLVKDLVTIKAEQGGTREIANFSTEGGILLNAYNAFLELGTGQVSIKTVGSEETDFLFNNGNIYAEFVLFNNSSSAAGADVTCDLSKLKMSVWNSLNALRIEYKDNTGLRGSTTVSNPQIGDVITLSTQFVDEGTLATKTRNVTLGEVSSGKATITTQAQGMSQIYSDGTCSYTPNAERIAITRVVGIA